MAREILYICARLFKTCGSEKVRMQLADDLADMLQPLGPVMSKSTDILFGFITPTLSLVFVAVAIIRWRSYSGYRNFMCGAFGSTCLPRGSHCAHMLTSIVQCR